MPDQNCAAKIETVHQVSQIIGPRIDIVTGSRLIGRAVSPPVMGDGTVTFGIEKQHLCFPRRTGQWPAVRENNRRSGAPVTIVDCGTVTGLDCRHGISPLLAAFVASSTLLPLSISTRALFWAAGNLPAQTPR